MELLTKLNTYISKQEQLIRPEKLQVERASVRGGKEKKDPSAGGKIQVELEELVHRAGKTFTRRRKAWVNPKIAEEITKRRKATDWVKTLSNYARMYYVGGYVRDILMHKISKDIDIVTLEPLDNIKKLFDQLNIKYYHNSQKEDTIRFKIGDIEIDITSADPNDLVADLARRDFTINAMAQNVTGQLYDPFDASTDLKEKILRSPYSNSKRAFKEDPIRILRAARFIGDYGLTPHPTVIKGIEAYREKLSKQPTERIGKELAQIMQASKPWKSLEFLQEYDLLKYICPDLDKMVGFKQNHPNHKHDVWKHTLEALKAAKSDDLVLNLAILFHDVGKPDTADKEQKHFIGHENKGADIVRETLTKLHFPSGMVKRVTNLVANHMRPLTLPSNANIGAYRRLKLEMEEDLDRLFKLARADTSASAKPALGRIKRVENKTASIKNLPTGKQNFSPLDGNEIMQELAIEPGPQLGDIKEYLSQLVVDDKLEADDKEGAILAAKKYRNMISKQLNTMIKMLEETDDNR